MHGVILKDTIQTFGLVDGFKFWFGWSIKDPIKEFMYLNITHKPYCLNCGWHCNGNCNKKKLLSKKEILNHFDEMRIEAETIEKGNNDMCVYCGEEKGTEIMDNPNIDKLSRWLICKDCKEVIKNQQDFTLGSLIGNNKLIEQSQDKLKEISERTKKPIFIGQINKIKGRNYKDDLIEIKEKDKYILNEIIFNGEQK